MCVAKIQLLACDVCQATEDVQTYRVQMPSKERFDVDLCREHAEPAIHWREVVAASKKRSSTRQPAVVYSDLSEIPRTD